MKPIQPTLYLASWLAAATGAFLHAQTQAPVPVIAGVRTESAQCSAIARQTACLYYTKPPFPETIGTRSPEFDIVRVTGPENAAVVQATVHSPGNRQWLRLRRAGAPVGGVSISDRLPLDLEIYVDDAHAYDMRAGRFVATLTITVAGVAAPVKLPVQLTVGPDDDVITATPSFIPDLIVGATQTPQPLRYNIGVARNGVGPPFHVSATAETSDGGTWLRAELQGGFAPCSTSVVPCELEVIVTPPQTPGDYWGALLISGDGYSDRVAVRVKVTDAPGLNPPLIEPREISLSAPLGSFNPVRARVELKGGYDGLSFRAVQSSPWLTVDPTSARWPAVLKVFANPAGLDAGLYTESIQLRTTDTSESLGTIPVNFTITAPAYVPVLFDGGGWYSSLYLVNPGAKEVKANVRFWTSPRDTGEPWLLGLAGRGLTTLIENEVIPPLGMRVIKTQGLQTNRQQGWAEVASDGPLAVHAELSEVRSTNSARAFPVETTLPMGNSFRDRLLLPFDNLGAAAASILLANPEDQAVAVDVTVLNEDGAEIAREGKFTLGALGAAAFELPGKWPSSAKRVGVLALDFDGRRLLASGSRKSGLSSHAYPAVARWQQGLERGIPRVTAGGNWQSTIYLTNMSGLAQNGALRLLPETPGEIFLESALPVPANGIQVVAVTPRGQRQREFQLARKQVFKASGRLRLAAPIDRGPRQ